MNYAQLLKNYIIKSRYTLDDISELLSKKDVSASKQYLSKLQNGRTPPASEELNRALAEITGGEPEALVMAAYTEKAPDSVKELLLNAKNIEEVLNQVSVLNTKLSLAYKNAEFLIMADPNSSQISLDHAIVSMDLEIDNEEFEKLAFEEKMRNLEILLKDLKNINSSVDIFITSANNGTLIVAEAKSPTGSKKANSVLGSMKLENRKLEIVANILDKYNFDLTDPNKQQMFEDMIQFALKLSK